MRLIQENPIAHIPLNLHVKICRFSESFVLYPLQDKYVIVLTNSDNGRGTNPDIFLSCVEFILRENKDMDNMLLSEPSLSADWMLEEDAAWKDL